MLRPRRWHRSTAGSPHQPHGAASEQTPIGPAKVEDPDRRACIMTPLRRSTPCGALASEKACPVPIAMLAHGGQVSRSKEHPHVKDHRCRTECPLHHGVFARLCTGFDWTCTKLWTDTGWTCTRAPQ